MKNKEQKPIILLKNHRNGVHSDESQRTRCNRERMKNKVLHQWMIKNDEEYATEKQLEKHLGT